MAVPLPVRTGYTYRVPSRFQQNVAVGKRVLVPFGRRKLTGYVLGQAKATPEPRQIKNIIDVLDETPLFPATLGAFFHWVADYYIHPIGEVIQAALPSGLTMREQAFYHLTDSGRQVLAAGDPDEDTRSLLQRLDLSPCKFIQLQHEAAKELTRWKLNSLVAKGWVDKRTVLAGGRTRPKTERFVIPMQIDFQNKRLSAQRQKILEALHAHGALAITELKTLIPTAANLVRAMVRDAQVALEERVVYRDPLGTPIAPDRAPELTSDQKSAVDIMGQALGRGYQTFLMAGVTGSGKTEVYLHMAAEALKCKLPVLVLVPEIALVSQVERAFRARFGDGVALLHSGLSNGERYDQWLRIARGEALIAIGARSAIFAPFGRLGLVIVDEEHDDSYKQEGALRYNARDLAVVRAQKDDALAILGSATPSVQSTHNARSGKYKQVTLFSRVDNRTLPEIFVQDLTLIREERGLRRYLTPTLIAAIQDTLARDEQVLLFLNRRGFAGTLVCAACGQPLRCDHCDISMTFHQRINAYMCHYCGFTRGAGACCSQCGSSQIKRLGLGTEKLETEIAKLFPQAKVARLDRDTTRRKGSTIKILKALRERKTDILVGTQMVAKGHDYPHITLVGIICADLSLSLPDFRAGERTFQLLAQVAGRAGRGRSPGQVILQTYNPQHYSITAARNQDYDAFFRQEVEFRKALGYPPYTRMIQIRVNGRDQRRTADYARLLGRYCQGLQQSRKSYAALETMGPIEAPLARIARQYRWQLLVKGFRVGLLHGFVCDLLFGPKAVPKKQGVAISLDVDPVFLM